MFPTPPSQYSPSCVFEETFFQFLSFLWEKWKSNWNLCEIGILIGSAKRENINNINLIRFFPPLLPPISNYYFTHMQWELPRITRWVDNFHSQMNYNEISSILSAITLKVFWVIHESCAMTLKKALRSGDEMRLARRKKVSVPFISLLIFSVY